jgi:rhodanese-related sulfurtransferase
MKCNTILVVFILAAFLWSPIDSMSVNFQPEVNKYKTISSSACDSLIQANALNPDFVILDVRTPEVWKSDHLVGSINRNYYDADFDAQLNALPKNKIFLLHCQSGGRSAPTLAKMKTMNFAEVYEMSSGINAWKAKGLPTTSLLAPKIMLVSSPDIKNTTFTYGKADTLMITLTNRANDTLKFTSITLPEGNEFSSDFDLKRKITGSEDYTFSLFYNPQNFSKDSVKLEIRSNGGSLSIDIVLKSTTLLENLNSTLEKLRIYPNPANDVISLQSHRGAEIQELSIVDINGRFVKKGFNVSVNNQMKVSDLSEGLYFVRILSEGQVYYSKLIVNR